MESGQDELNSREELDLDFKSAMHYVDSPEEEIISDAQIIPEKDPTPLSLINQAINSCVVPYSVHEIDNKFYAIFHNKKRTTRYLGLTPEEAFENMQYLNDSLNKEFHGDESCLENLVSTQDAMSSDSVRGRRITAFLESYNIETDSNGRIFAFNTEGNSAIYLGRNPKNAYKKVLDIVDNPEEFQQYISGE